jgi:hypothetical protein
VPAAGRQDEPADSCKKPGLLAGLLIETARLQQNGPSEMPIGADSAQSRASQNQVNITSKMAQALPTSTIDGAGVNISLAAPLDRQSILSRRKWTP